MNGYVRYVKGSISVMGLSAMYGIPVKFIGGTSTEIYNCILSCNASFERMSNSIFFSIL